MRALRFTQDEPLDALGRASRVRCRDYKMRRDTASRGDAGDENDDAIADDWRASVTAIFMMSIRDCAMSSPSVARYVRLTWRAILQQITAQAAEFMMTPPSR